MAKSAESETSWFTELASIPVYASARFVSDQVVQVVSSSRDHTRNAKRTTSKTFFLDSNANGAVNVIPSASQDVSPEVVASATSPSGKLTVILRETNSGDKKRFVEVWEGERLEASVDVTGTHGSFYADDQLGSLSFSPSETALVYTAEAKAPDNDDDLFAKFRLVPDFGEGYIGKKRPTLFVVRWTSSAGATGAPSKDDAPSIRSVPFPEEVTPAIFLGQAQFATDDTLLTTGFEYSNDGKLLGIKGCLNRPTAIWELKLDFSFPADTESTNTPITASATKISDTKCSTRSARIIPGSNTALWLSHELGGPHASCSSLHSFGLQAREGTTLVPVVEKTNENVMDGFAGLYADGLIARPFVRSGNRTYLLAQTSQGSRTEVILVDVKKRETVVRLTPAESGDDLWSWAPLATDGKKWILAARSAPTVPNELVLGKLEEDGEKPKVRWQVIEKPSVPSPVQNALDELKASILPIPDRYPVETIVFEPKQQKSQPLLSFIHGGPHGQIPTAFAPALAAFALEGFTLNVPNYTGSTGFGDFYVQKLMGQCGTLDVQDVKASVDFLVKEGKAAHGPNKQFITGGSHGGFLGAHLIGQYPDTFSAAVLRNPVISSQPASTDIPDWYFYEFGVTPSAETEQMPPALYAQLYPASPIAHVRNVKAPVLLLLGLEDRRVINVQGKTFYHALKGLGKTVEVLAFAGEGHPLDGVEAARVGWEVTVDWFRRQMS
ncbi:alpha/beta-hydrolase [Gloeopeniophorella convolvens]|nr:alpha/beta-hydrolase [Gloeopeniophorella convolvens]